jgi:hypothetical protein
VGLNTKELARFAAVLRGGIEKQERENATTVGEIKQKAGQLLDAVNKVASSHSGSNFGYHGALYYQDFQVPQLGSMFNVEWGGINGIPPGWTKREPDEVKLRIEKIASLTFAAIEKTIQQPLNSAKQMQGEILIQLAPLHQLPDGNREKQLLQGLEQFDWKDSARHDYLNAALKGYPNMTRDSGAISQGCMLTSHDYYGAEATQIVKSCEAIEGFWSSAERLLRQLEVVGSSKLVTQDDPVGTPDLSVKYERLRVGFLLLGAFVLSVIIAAGAGYVTMKLWPWQWLLSHPNRYAIEWLGYAVLLLFLIGLFVRKFRNYCWGFALIPLIVGILQSLGGPPPSPH